MTAWFHADTQDRQHGPVSSDELHRLYAEGVVNDDTLIWREGMPQWRPLRSVAGTPDLPTLQLRRAPPPLPGVDADADARAARARRAQADAEAARRRGYRTVLKVVIGCALLAGAVVGLVSYYQSRTERVRERLETVLLKEAAAPRRDVVAFMRDNYGICPEHGNGVKLERQYTTPHLARVRVEGTYGGFCTIDLTLQGLGNEVEDDTVRIAIRMTDREHIDWICGTVTANAKYLPEQCARGYSGFDDRPIGEEESGKAGDAATRAAAPPVTTGVAEDFDENDPREGISRAISGARALQDSIDDFHALREQCPDNAAIGADTNSAAIGPRADPERMVVWTRLGSRDGACTIELRFESRMVPAMHRKTLLFVRGSDGWTCTDGSLPEALRPQSCRQATTR